MPKGTLDEVNRPQWTLFLPLLPVNILGLPLVFGLGILGGNAYGNYAERLDSLRKFKRL